jgi:hypothetical protein
MKTISIALVAALLAVGGGATAFAFATPAPAETTSDACINGPKDVVPCATWAVKCIGDALGGNACHGPPAAATLAADESPVVDCVKRAVRDVLNGVTPMPCPVAAATDSQLDPQKVADCVVYVWQQWTSGNPVEPCDVSYAAANAEADNDVVDFAVCMVNGVYRNLKGQPAGFCYLPAETADADGPKDVVECAKKNVRDILQGTPQPCPVL